MKNETTFTKREMQLLLEMAEFWRDDKMKTGLPSYEAMDVLIKLQQSCYSRRTQR